MRRVGYYYCPRCDGEQLYVMHEPPWDENMAECGGNCGHVFGYMVSTETTVDELGHVLHHAAPRPVLPPEVLLAGMKKFQDEVAAKLMRMHGGDHVYRATRDLHAGLASDDPQVRRRLLNSRAPQRPR